MKYLILLFTLVASIASAQFSTDRGSIFSEHRKHFRIHSEFLGQASSAIYLDGYLCETIGSGTINSIPVPGSTGHPGQVQMAASPAGTNSYACLRYLGAVSSGVQHAISNATMFLETSMYLPNADFTSGGTQSNAVWFGFANNAAGSFLATENQAMFRYSYVSTEWQTVAGNGTAATTTTNASGVTVSAATWYRLGMLFAPDNSSIKFYINGVQVANHTSNLPGHIANMQLSAGIRNVNGAVVLRTNYVDYITQVYQLNTAR